MTDADLELPAELDTSDPDVLATLLHRAFSEADTAEFLEALVQIGGSLPAGALGGSIPEGEFTVKCTDAVRDVLASLRGTKPKQQMRRKVQRALRIMRDAGPEHRSLQSHRYHNLKGKNGEDVWESYIEHKIANAWRAWWYFVLDEPNTILVAAVGPHPKRSLTALPPH
ncbi:hypothetical protein MMAG44476_14380 [Mycolicibacterium mageritense DSM 44476 = CIP 104973]|uniref:Uncharacterized protein n=1 Tax=Mycolicibacterium mageritense TaxID=53462 RepID=A0ABN5Y653_MYCME|nr:hypothetical protein [Mycolicibacterium mageritense]BBX33644.1 hypothetical protein MMAGJ_29260 [Mycolicibacterium mageritense]CDO22072.1 hypothetical protein BN978_02537 [Mycolicibacterium mageritense DSM 44476 = CIP 104973]